MATDTFWPEANVGGIVDRHPGGRRHEGVQRHQSVRECESVPGRRIQLARADAARGHSARCDPACDFLLGSALPVDFFRDHPRIEEHYDALLYLGLSRR